MLTSLDEPQFRQALTNLYTTDGVITALVLSLGITGLLASRDSFTDADNLFKSTTEVFAQLYYLAMFLSVATGCMGLFYCVHAFGEISLSRDTKEAARSMGIMATFAWPVIAANVSLTFFLTACAIYLGLTCRIWVCCIGYSIMLLLGVLNAVLSGLPTKAKLLGLARYAESLAQDGGAERTA